MKYLYEFIGTFFLVFTIGMVIMSPNIPAGFAPIAIGAVLTALIFAGGHVSGGHYNPAVSFAIFLRGKMGASDMLIYWAVQVIAGFAAAIVALYVLGGGAQVPSLQPVMLPALIAEFLFTFALVFTVLNVATAKGAEGNSFYGWAIGMTVLAGAYAVGTISGAAFNPAVATGISQMGIVAWSNLWIYLVAELVGAAVAVLIFRAAHPGE